jgi:hypothetical protein
MVGKASSITPDSIIAVQTLEKKQQWRLAIQDFHLLAQIRSMSKSVQSLVASSLYRITSLSRQRIQMQRERFHP